VAEVSQRVLDMVRRELVQNPEIENAILYEKAKQLDPAAMKDVDRRQFNARYPLRVKRFEMRARKPRPKAEPRRDGRPAAPAGDSSDVAVISARGPRQEGEGAPRRRARSTASPAASPVAAGPGSVLRHLARDGVRDVLLRFAQDMANAESRGDLVGVVAGVDQYVDQIMGMGFPD
jgi:hypothetical protein